MTPYYQWCFLSWVRILDSGQEANNAIRVEYSTTGEATKTIAAGLYPLGLGSGTFNPWGVADSTVFGQTTLLGVFAGLFNMLPSYLFASLLNNASANVSLPVVAAADGHIVMNFTVPAGESFTIKWNDPLTTVNPAWFGIAKNDGVYEDTVIGAAPSGAWADISQMSSTLALVGNRVLGQEPFEESYKEVGIAGGDGSISWKGLGDGVDEISRFRINATGRPRASQDSSFHSLRRWYRQLRFNRARRRFLYVPDLSISSYPKQWSPDDQAEVRRWGWRDMSPNPIRVPSFEEVQRFRSSNKEWQLTLPVRTFVP